MRSGILLTFVLLFVAGWIPTLGQIIAGYVGGRKSGSPYKGLVATAVATLLMLVILTIVSLSLDSINSALASDPEGEIAKIAESSPFLGQLAAIGVDYLRKIFGNANMTVNYGTYMLTIVFGIIGGVIADQNRKEIRLAVANADKANENRLRSISLFKRGRKMGFESYDDYTSLSVNSLQPVTPKKKPFSARPIVKEPTVTGTVDTTPVGTPTSTADVKLESVSQETQVINELPRLDDDISDCI
jgi:hypothetical protein